MTTLLDQRQSVLDQIDGMRDEIVRTTSELVRIRSVSPGTFAELSRRYSEREICDIVWLIASEHVYNMTNIGLGIGSDGMCEQRARGHATTTAAAS